jgi:PhnB protein
MSTKVKPIPDGCHTLTPYLTMKGAAQALDFYKKAFGAKEMFRMYGAGGKIIGHAQITIGNSLLMLADPPPGSQAPEAVNGAPVTLVLHVEDVDAAFAQAVKAGATVMLPLENKFYGDRSGCVLDPYGYRWTLMTHVEDVPLEELNKRMAQFSAKMAEQHQG